MRSLFRKPRQPEAGELVEERWSSSFGPLHRGRFAREVSRDYTTTVRRGRLELTILKPDCFAWTTAPYRYRDFVLEGRISIDPGNGHSAAGFVFRQINEENFYYFLLSNRGQFRLDVVFNRNPFHLIQWTPVHLGEADGGELKLLDLRLLARGDRFAFFLDDEWIAEVNDDTIPEGAFGFAAQNYGDHPEGRFFLNSVTVDSRPVEVEREYYRWVHVVPARPESRITLARSFLAMGKPVEALGQLRRGVLEGSAGAEELLLLGQCYLGSQLYPEAVEALDRCLALEPHNRAALVNRADALYLGRDYLAARDYLVGLLTREPGLSQDPYLRSLLGSCEYSLGNWELSERSYRAAVEGEPENALYRENLARSLERLGRSSEALQAYLEAGRLLFHAQMHDELSLVIARAQWLLGPGQEAAGLELEALEGMMLYQEGKRREAETVFRELLERGFADSAVEYLYGLILIENGRRAAAEPYLASAAAREDSIALYWFRLAENRYLLQQEGPSTCGLDEALERAYGLDSQDPWINNLYGQVLIHRSQPERALEFFQRAHTAAEDSVDILKNWGDALLRLGRCQEAVELADRGLERCGEQAQLLNLRGNSRVQLGQFAAAREDYERALELEPDNLDFMENCATCCLELDLILRAEELLNHVLEKSPSAWAYNLTGSLAMRKNEHERARLAFEEALKLDPGNREVELNLVSLHLDQGHYEEAKKALRPLLESDPEDSRARELRERLRERFETRLVCDGCGREWWVPREIPPQPGFSLRGEPPGEAPAGRCPSCGRLYCIACASAHVAGQRLICPECGEPLRISEEPLKYLLLQYVNAASGSETGPRAGRALGAEP
ncbi:MAG: tetratricopeptide repeat protein [Spirochaetales bacterium]|nr:tetratricopeptide repeat protein [Spirochaetales bacterium]